MSPILYRFVYSIHFPLIILLLYVNTSKSGTIEIIPKLISAHWLSSLSAIPFERGTRENPPTTQPKQHARRGKYALEWPRAANWFQTGYSQPSRRATSKSLTVKLMRLAPFILCRESFQVGSTWILVNRTKRLFNFDESSSSRRKKKKTKTKRKEI